MFELKSGAAMADPAAPMPPPLEREMSRPPKTIAWREPGEIWKAVSSRIVTARIKVAREDDAMY